MLEAAGRQGGATLVLTRRKLRRLVGDLDAEAMLTGVNADGELASLGLLTGLGRLARGEITRAEFARAYGHRGPHEFEISLPRPGEDPAWIDAQLAGLRDAARRHRGAARAPGAGPRGGVGPLRRALPARAGRDAEPGAALERRGARP